MEILTNRSLTKTEFERGFLDPIPFGWFFVCYSDELQNGEVRNVEYFCQQWVLFRNSSGVPGLIDPYCPHLGAHLGVGGKVDGNWLRCPFHAWAFDVQGVCWDIPYCEKKPAILGQRPLLKALPLVERNKIVWAWYHPQGVAPLWEVEDLSEAINSNWTEYVKYEFQVSTSIQDILENSVDYAHLKYVHGHSAVLKGTTLQEGRRRNVKIAADIHVLDPQGKLVPCHYSIGISQLGPGHQVVRYRRIVDLEMMFLVTPVSKEKVILRFAFTHPKYEELSYEERLVRDLMLEKVGSRGQMSGVYADIPIWNHKIYRKLPLLCEGDGPIMEFRAWFSQFLAYG